jgi:hypothetical protein
LRPHVGRLVAAPSFVVSAAELPSVFRRSFAIARQDEPCSVKDRPAFAIASSTTKFGEPTLKPPLALTFVPIDEIGCVTVER